MTQPQPPAILPADPELLPLPHGLELLRFYDPSRGPWDLHRSFGPLDDMRFDHHPPPPATYAGRSVWYAACSVRGAVAEAFGWIGVLDRTCGRRIVKTEVIGEIEVLNLVGVAARRVGLTQEIAATTDYATCQTWARAFYEGYPVHGIRWRARQSGSLCVVLNDRARMNHLAARRSTSSSAACEDCRERLARRPWTGRASPAPGL